MIFAPLGARLFYSRQSYVGSSLRRSATAFACTGRLPLRVSLLTERDLGLRS